MNPDQREDYARAIREQHRAIRIGCLILGVAVIVAFALGFVVRAIVG